MGSAPPPPPLGCAYGYKLVNNKIYLKTTVFDEVCNTFNSYYLINLTLLEVLINKETQFLRTLKTFSGVGCPWKTNLLSGRNKDQLERVPKKNPYCQSGSNITYYYISQLVCVL